MQWRGLSRHGRWRGCGAAAGKGCEASEVTGVKEVHYENCGRFTQGKSHQSGTFIKSADSSKRVAQCNQWTVPSRCFGNGQQHMGHFINNGAIICASEMCTASSFLPNKLLSRSNKILDLRRSIVECYEVNPQTFATAIRDYVQIRMIYHCNIVL